MAGPAFLVYESLRNIVLFEDHDEDFLASLADSSAARKEVSSTSVWRERLLARAREAVHEFEKGELHVHI